MNFGQGPATDTAEIIVFGPGYGECIVMHLGQGEWAIVDSCIDRETGRSVARDYLDSIGVSKDKVKNIIVTHWHDDHIKGMYDLVEYYSEALVWVSQIISNKETLKVLSAFGGADISTETKGTREIFNIMRFLMSNKLRLKFASERTNLVTRVSSTFTTRLNALSPTSQAILLWNTFIATTLKLFEDGKADYAPEMRPNSESVVLHLDLGAGTTALLGSDMEDLKKSGWTAILLDAKAVNLPKATLFKVAHHGSSTGHHADIWTDMLSEDPVAVLTPFQRGKTRLPSTADQVRIKNLSASSFLSSTGSQKVSYPPDLTKLIKRRAKVIKVETGFGAIRLRRQYGASTWTHELFGKAAAM